MSESRSVVFCTPAFAIFLYYEKGGENMDSFLRTSAESDRFVRRAVAITATVVAAFIIFVL